MNTSMNLNAHLEARREAPSQRERLADMLLLARLQLLREVCEDLRSGVSPYPRLLLAQRSLEQDEDFSRRQDEQRFVERILSAILGSTRHLALSRLQKLELREPCAQAPARRNFWPG